MNSLAKSLLVVGIMVGCWYLFIKDMSPVDRMTAPATPSEASRGNAPVGTSVTPAQGIDTARLRMYAETLGRAYGCGYRPEEELARVRNWLDTSLIPGSKVHQVNFNEFLETMKSSAEQQREGKSSYTCIEAETSLKTTSWP